ncbi:MAG TPA: tetratricopeptide repeat protein [Burkholderiales bacterium]|nr:tetratricopeptide repeat protein [Burkholderiales bacterium]
MSAASRLLALAAALLLAGCAATAQNTPDAADAVDDDEPAQAAGTPPDRLPAQDLSESLLYELLLAEVALQRGDAALAAQSYVELARRTKDPRVARRAVEVANAARAPQLALESARTWHEADPASLQALQTLTALLVSARQVEQAEPYLAQLLAKDGAAAANGFLQLSRLLGGNPDKQANLRLVRALAAKHPALPQARLAVAQAALAADDAQTALAEARRAAQLAPDWEAAAIFEAQVLQRKSPAQAGAALAAYLEKYPKAREARLSYARLLAGEKRYAEARAEFEKLLAAHPNNGDVMYAVGLLALQLKDYATAEANLRRLLDTGFRDPNGVRFTLGQAAEEQKKWDDAIGWYESIQRGEHFLPARMRAAGVMAKQGRLAEARKYLRAQGAEGEQGVQLLIAEAQLLREANQHRDAFDLLGEALRAQPDQPELLYDHALTAEKLERFEILEGNLRKVIQIKPDHAHAYNALGYSFADRNLRLHEARKLIERALELSPQDYFIIDSMGWVLYRMGDLKGAAAQLRRAYEGRPDGEIGAHLGEVLWMMGERAEAERIWLEALRNHAENETLQKTVKRLRR